MSAMKVEGLRQHWFYLAAGAILAADIVLARTDAWEAPRLIEVGILFDLAILIPALYAICYRDGGRRTALRVLALACLGLWAAGHVVPNEHHAALTHLSWLRYLGLAVLIAVEIKLVLMIWRSVIASGGAVKNIDELASREGMPPWVARLMAWEAGLWLRLARAVKRCAKFILGR